MKTKKYESIQQVWEDFNRGVTIYWANESYKLYAEKANCKYQDDHFTNKDGKVLSIRCISNYFGGLMDSKELCALFSKGE